MTVNKLRVGRRPRAIGAGGEGLLLQILPKKHLYSQTKARGGGGLEAVATSTLIHSRLKSHAGMLPKRNSDQVITIPANRTMTARVRLGRCNLPFQRPGRRRRTSAPPYMAMGDCGYQARLLEASMASAGCLHRVCSIGQMKTRINRMRGTCDSAGSMNGRSFEGDFVSVRSGLAHRSPGFRVVPRRFIQAE